LKVAHTAFRPKSSRESVRTMSCAASAGSSADATSPENACCGGWRVFYTQQHGDDPTYGMIKPEG